MTFPPLPAALGTDATAEQIQFAICQELHGRCACLNAGRQTEPMMTRCEEATGCAVAVLNVLRKVLSER